MLCWYQRICIYPLVFIFGVGLLKEDRNCLLYAWPLIVSGVILSAYHNLLYYGVIPEAIAPCKEGVSCISKHVEYLGFITIPLLSLGGFVALGTLNYLANKYWRQNENIDNKLTADDKRFLISFFENTTDWDLFSEPSAQNLPAIKWKLLNINIMMPPKK